MIDLIKKTVLAGIGAGVVTKEKVEAILQDLVKQGKVSASEAKDMAHKIAEEGRKEFETASHDLSGRVKDLMSKANFASKTELDALVARVAALEEKLARLETPAGA